MLFNKMSDTNVEMCKVDQYTAGLQAAGWVQLMIHCTGSGGQGPGYKLHSVESWLSPEWWSSGEEVGPLYGIHSR